MHAPSQNHGVSVGTNLRVCVVDPDAALPSDADIRRLVGSPRNASRCREALARYPRMVVTCRGASVGVAAYDRVDAELRVPAFAVSSSRSCSSNQVGEMLIEALETACLATGGKRLVLTPEAGVIWNTLDRRGYTCVFEGCAGSWFEKTFK